LRDRGQLDKNTAFLLAIDPLSANSSRLFNIKPWFIKESQVLAAKIAGRERSRSDLSILTSDTQYIDLLSVV